MTAQDSKSSEGRTERTITDPFYASTAILAQGLSEFSYNLGVRRDRVGTVDSDYGPPAFLGQHLTRRGLSVPQQQSLPQRLFPNALGRHRADAVPQGRLVQPLRVHDALPLEHVADGVVTWLGKRDAQGRGHHFQEFVRHLHEHACTVAGKRVGADGAAMGQMFEDR